MDRLSDRGSIPLRSIFEKPWKSLISGVFCYLVERKNAVLNRFKLITHDLGVVAEVCDDVAVMYCGRVVERGDVKTIFANPSHPYTKGLLGSIPRLGDAGKELKSIPGNVPNPKYMPKGCKFAPRCPYASEKCREDEPGFFQIEEGHISRCWLCESGQLKTDHVEKAGD